ncbi:hypothetical protein VSR68_36105 [Paraburkholderia phymatum]|uniref:hypothetical protein n=1 Tax=Paraburkholderia phymatum TaxID=148447 RepID=UPI00317BD299
MQAIEKPGSERFLENLDLPADCRLSHAEFIGGQRETAVTCDRLEFDERSHRRDEPPVSLGPRSDRFHLAQARIGYEWETNVDAV